MFGINVSDLNFGICPQQLSVGSGNMSHCGTPACYYHLNHGFFVLQDIQHSIGTRVFPLMIFGLLAGTLAQSRDALRGDHLSTRSKLLRGATFNGPIRFPQHLFSVHDHGQLHSGREPRLLPALT